MEEMFSFPISRTSIEEYGGVQGLQQSIRKLNCSGIEAIWGGDNAMERMPKGIVIGYHLIFYPDWIDFWKGNEKRLTKKFGDRETYHSFYGGWDRSCLIRQYREDLHRAERLKVRYVVFHVSDVSIEEGYSYRWEHTDNEIIDATAELINLLTAEREYPFEILMENQWWPGLTLTDPKKTKRLLDQVNTPRKGLMLDTGHLMNTNPRLETQHDGVEYLVRMLQEHGELCQYVHGVHLHQSLSGRYVREHMGNVPKEASGKYLDQYAQNYSHILRIDQHRPWTDPDIRRLFAYISPNYLTHELRAKTPEDREAAVMIQRSALRTDRQNKYDICDF